MKKLAAKLLPALFIGGSAFAQMELFVTPTVNQPHATGGNLSIIYPEQAMPDPDSADHILFHSFTNVIGQRHQEQLDKHRIVGTWVAVVTYKDAKDYRYVHVTLMNGEEGTKTILLSPIPIVMTLNVRKACDAFYRELFLKMGAPKKSGPTSTKQTEALL